VSLVNVRVQRPIIVEDDFGFNKSTIRTARPYSVLAKTPTPALPSIAGTISSIPTNLQPGKLRTSNKTPDEVEPPTTSIYSNYFSQEGYSRPSQVIRSKTTSNSFSEPKPNDVYSSISKSSIRSSSRLSRDSRAISNRSDSRKTSNTYKPIHEDFSDILSKPVVISAPRTSRQPTVQRQPARRRLSLPRDEIQSSEEEECCFDGLLKNWLCCCFFE